MTDNEKQPVAIGPAGFSPDDLGDDRGAQINPYMKLGDMNLTTEELVVAVYMRGQRIMQQDLQMNAMRRRIGELERANAELNKEIELLKPQPEATPKNGRAES